MLMERALRVIDRKHEELQKAEQDQSQLFQESLSLARKLATAQARIARLRQELDAASSKTKAAFEEEEASIEEQENFEKEVGISLSKIGDLELFDFEAVSSRPGIAGLSTGSLVYRFRDNVTAPCLSSKRFRVNPEPAGCVAPRNRSVSTRNPLWPGKRFQMVAAKLTEPAAWPGATASSEEL
ncbi:hypothetical protein Dda_6912 [Drechslerella dactyloides]|uniref:Uncharacterized protein n=1 Tax=Drechslerella dactyloides TaxID=74499 RepID=A0AAD6IUR1_DREDA|nr:hypothetical protein Dda_6912 [Drechslerella dactyloides]